MIWIIAMVLLIMWFAGYKFNFGGKAIHMVLVIALIVVLAKLLL